jgi:hypothetical protein
VQTPGFTDVFEIVAAERPGAAEDKETQFRALHAEALRWSPSDGPRPPRARRPLAAQWPPGTPTRLAGAFFSLEATTPAGTRKASQWLSYESGGACSDSVEPRQGQARVVRLRVRLLACVGAMPQHGRPVKAGAAVGGSAS